MTYAKGSSDRARDARESAHRAKDREIATHQRAADVQDEAAETMERAGHPEQAARVRMRAQAERRRVDEAEVEKRDADRRGR